MNVTVFSRYNFNRPLNAFNSFGLLTYLLTYLLNTRAVERGGQWGKLPRAPRQRRGPAILQNEFLSSLVTKAKVIIQNFYFYQLCDNVSSTDDSGTGMTTDDTLWCFHFLLFKILNG